MKEDEAMGDARGSEQFQLNNKEDRRNSEGKECVFYGALPAKTWWSSSEYS
ncbi:MAG: hypothetical protein GX811_10605 [Lentisphaerae bacterium]|nr:hypothetical protein [Lentisphaerota bacterium]